MNEGTEQCQVTFRTMLIEPVRAPELDAVVLLLRSQPVTVDAYLPKLVAQNTPPVARKPLNISDPGGRES